MSEVIVYGASDDLIEVEGAIREEFTANRDGEANLLAFSDGTLLEVTYTDAGIWRIASADHSSTLIMRMGMYTGCGPTFVMTRLARTMDSGRGPRKFGVTEIFTVALAVAR